MECLHPRRSPARTSPARPGGLASRLLPLLLALPVLAHAAPAPIPDGPCLLESLETFLAPAGTEAAGVLARADLREGHLTAGSPLVSRYARSTPCPEGLACLELAVPGRSTVGLLPLVPTGTREVALRALVAPSPGGDSHLDLLVDDEVVLADQVLPGTGFRTLVLDPGPGLTPGHHRVELRLAPGSAPVRLLALDLLAAPGRTPRDLGRQARRRRADARVAPAQIPVHEYYPLTVGRHWTYDSLFENRRFTNKVDAQLVYHGAQVYRTRRLDMQAEYELMSADAAGIRFWYRQDDANGGFDMSDSPVPFSLGPYVKLGDRFEAIPHNTQNPITGGFIHWIIDYRRFTPVTVPAGTFPEALHLRVRNFDTKSGIEIATMNLYLGRGIGVIRRDGRVVTVNFKHLLVSHG